MATKNKKLTRRLSTRAQEKGFQIKDHSGSLQKEALSDALDILASMIYEYLKWGENDE